MPVGVIGKDHHQVFIKHGGLFVRVHPCSLNLVNAPVSLENKTNEVGAGDCINQDSNGSVQEDVAGSDSELIEIMSNESLVFPLEILKTMELFNRVKVINHLMKPWSTIRTRGCLEESPGGSR